MTEEVPTGGSGPVQNDVDLGTEAFYPNTVVVRLVDDPLSRLLVGIPVHTFSESFGDGVTLSGFEEFQCTLFCHE